MTTSIHAESAELRRRPPREVAVVLAVGGIGLAIARRIGSGRTLVLADVDTTALDAAGASLWDDGHEVVLHPVDVSDAAAVAGLAAAAAVLGPVTQVVHTAAVSPAQADAQRLLRVDLLGVAHVLDAFGGVVADGGVGLVVASLAGHMAPRLSAAQERALALTPSSALLDLPVVAALQDAGSAYLLAKHATILRVQAAAPAWGRRGARLNAISPGVIATTMGRAVLNAPGGERMQQTVEASAAGRWGTPDDVADAAAFLLGPQSRFVTGTDLLVDGGAVAAVRPSWERPDAQQG